MASTHALPAEPTSRAPSQAGILEGADPTVYDPKHPLTIFIIQAGIIIIFTRLLHCPLSLLRQPRVIAEVIGGILLGPSVLGRIPNFTPTIFPDDSIPNLTLVANLGLVLFLFLVGLEVDLRFFVGNWKLALSVGVAGMALPFGLGAGLSWGLYRDFRTETDIEVVDFAVYMLFIGIAMAITAFPVLCRILSELKLLSTPVGVVVLSAGVGNDVVGWILLALCVALVNAGSGLTALWVLLTCAGYILFLGLAVRPAFIWTLRRTRTLQDGPSQGIVALTLLMALASAFFTGVIGVHPIFGAFLAGLICPHEGGFAIKITEKVEDLVAALLLPLYFALSGLSTNVGLLDTGLTWAYVVGVIAVAFCGKFVGCSLAARLCGLVWRESFTIGALMSCKGLVELIVLNIGLQANILSQRTFTIFVVMALVTTFATTPLTAALYPPWYQRKLEAWKRGEIDWESEQAIPNEGDSEFNATREKLESTRVKNLLVYLRLDNMATLLALVSLLSGEPTSAVERVHPSRENKEKEPTAEPAQPKVHRLAVHGVRLVELTERGSTVMRVAEVDEYSVLDPVLNAFRVLSQLYNLAVSGEVCIVPEASFAETLVTRAAQDASDLLMLPWSETGSLSEAQMVTREGGKPRVVGEEYAAFIALVLETARCDTAVFVNRGFSGTLKPRPATLSRKISGASMRSAGRDQVAAPQRDRSHHVFLPYLGGIDGRAALRLVLRLIENPEVTATIVDFSRGDGSESQPKTTQRDGLAATTEQDAAFFATMQRSIPTESESRVIFETEEPSTRMDGILARAQLELGQNPKNGGDIIVIGRNVASGSCLGEVADVVLASGVRASLLVVQARGVNAT